MGKRRAAQVSSEDEEPSPPADDRRRRKQRRLRHVEYDDDADKNKDHSPANGSGARDGSREADSEAEGDEDEEAKAEPVGEALKVTGKGKKKKTHYGSFEFEGNVFELEDSVLLTPEDSKQKPYVAIIKDITEDVDGNFMVTGQWFYRPEEAEKKGGGNWQARDTRELFYSFHRDDVPAESVMHKCVVHFVPLNKKLPIRSQHPGFIVQKVYDTVEKKLWKLTDKDYEDGKQHEIDLLVQKTRERLGELPDLEPEETSGDQHDQANQAAQTTQITSKWNLRRKPVPSIDAQRIDGVSTRFDSASKAETPGSCPGDLLEYDAILKKFNALTRDSHRDKWLKKLLKEIQSSCKDLAQPTDHNAVRNTDGSSNASEKVFWPDAVVSAITALEKASHELLGSDFQKYNQKMRQLAYNLKNKLAERLVNGELEPSVVLTMTPDELKEGLTVAERATKEPEKTKQMQMTDARCSRCSKKEVGVADIIQAGGHGDRYQLECIACGHTWYASRDAISSLTIDTPNITGNVGTAPWATAKFEEVQKMLVSPRDSEKPASDLFQKSTAPYMPVLETQKSFNRSKPQETHDASATIEH
ncbi:uncharacterized protein LOC110017925 [Phalaenopsis equestris]|uniref:uncharacterized protein LOC110017925 n=1 Tax=Phalaenopsis equestris TaxID=78828 RepID=UPI0009E28CAC|nr:uncharacterized protein LOC110017925 [Phalaenopsis equestris]